jgi:hypothetical protein
MKTPSLFFLSFVATRLQFSAAWSQPIAPAMRSRPAAARQNSAKMYESYSSAFGQNVADPNVWYIFPRDTAGLIQSDYTVGLGQEQVLGRQDLMDRDHPMGPEQPLTPEQNGIAMEQCAVQIAQDGSHAMLYALGTQATGYRSGPDAPWTWLQPGESARMEHYWKISLDQSYPEVACMKLGDGYLIQQEEQQRQQQGGGYPQQGGGYPQQDGYR